MGTNLIKLSGFARLLSERDRLTSSALSKRAQTNINIVNLESRVLFFHFQLSSLETLLKFVSSIDTQENTYNNTADNNNRSESRIELKISALICSTRQLLFLHRHLQSFYWISSLREKYNSRLKRRLAQTVDWVS